MYNLRFEMVFRVFSYVKENGILNNSNNLVMNVHIVPTYLGSRASLFLDNFTQLLQNVDYTNSDMNSH
jgi:hypothetical protein